MFFNAPGNPSRLKRVVYLVATTILGILLSIIAHAFIEMGYLHWAEGQNLIVPFYGGCALPPVLRIALLVLGAVADFSSAASGGAKSISKESGQKIPPLNNLNFFSNYSRELVTVINYVINFLSCNLNSLEYFLSLFVLNNRKAKKCEI